MLYGRSAVAVLAAVFACPNLALAAQAPAAPGTRAVLEVELIVEAKHSEKDKYDTLDYEVKRGVAFSQEIFADTPASFGLGDSGGNAQLKTDTDALSQQSAAAMGNNADLMAKAEKAMEACGEDEACLQKFAMQMSQQADTKQQLQTMSKDVKGVKSSFDTMNANSPPRFQVWHVQGANKGKGSGQVQVAEQFHKTYFDPGCYETKNICTQERARKASYAVGSGPDGQLLTMAQVEVDTLQDRISVLIPYPAVPLTVDQTGNMGDGKRQIALVPNDGADWDKEMKLLAIPLTGAYTDQKGEKVIQIKSLDDYGGPAVLRVRWHFHTI